MKPHPSCFRLFTVASLSMAMAASAIAQAPPLGAGLEGIADWSRSNAFADLVKQSRGFGTPGQPWAAPVAVDKNGWPTEDFGIILGSWPGMKKIGGTYAISGICKTKPTIETTASPGQIKNLAWKSSDGTFTAKLDYPEGGEQLMLTFRNTGGGVRGLKVMRPGYAGSAVFTTPFLDHLRRFSTLRFMDWTATNGNPSVNWPERTQVAAPTYARGGVPWEVCADLGNALHKDIWINVPAMANAAYVKNLATVLAKRVDPSLHIYVEYSNEVWNWGFQQAQWNLAQAKAEVAKGGSPLNSDGNANEGVWAARRIVKRIKEISDVFRTAFGDSYGARVRPVLATQVSWPSHWLVEGLAFADNHYGGANKFLYACSGAPYFNLGEAKDSNDLTPTQVLDALDANVEAMKTDSNLEACATMTRFHNLKFVAYEGGPDTFGDKSVAAKRDASLDPRMKTISAKYLKVWYGYGFDLFNWFVAGATDYNTPYGTWGVLNDMSNTAAPKLAAIDATLARTSPFPVTQGMAIPGTVDARKCMFRDANWADQSPLELSAGDWRGPWRDYLLRATSAATYTIRLNATALQSGAKVQVWMNGGLLGTVAVAQSATGAYKATAPITVKLGQGIQALRLKLDGTVDCRVRDVKFTQ